MSHIATASTRHGYQRLLVRNLSENMLLASLADERGERFEYRNHILWYSPANNLLLVLSAACKLITAYQPKKRQRKIRKWMQ